MNVNGRLYDYRLYVLTPARREIGRGFVILLVTLIFSEMS